MMDEQKATTDKPQTPALPVYKRVMLVANKKWEADPLMNVLLESKATPIKFSFPKEHFKHPLPQGYDWTKPHPRAVISMTKKTKDEAGNDRDLEVAQEEIWCIEEWMD